MKKNIYIVLAFIFIFSSCIKSNKECNSNDIIINVSHKVWAENALRVDVSYELKDSIDSFIEYWSVENKTNKQKTFRQRSWGTKVTLINLKPDQVYNYKIIIEDSCKNISEIYQFKTNKLPKLLSKIELLENKNNEFIGYTLFHQSASINSHYLVITDNSGVVIWYQYIDDTSGPFSWTENHTILTLLGEEKIIEIDLLGNVIFELAEGQKGFDKKIHHEIRYINGNQILGLTRELLILSEPERIKYGIDTIKGDGIILLDQEGNKLWDWSLFDIQSPLNDDFDSIQIKDWGHANSVSMDKNGNYLISFKNFSQIWNINGKNGELNWKIGRLGDFNLNEDELFTEQHAAHINFRGDLMLFDNGGRSVVSRALSFKLDELNKKAIKIIDTKLAPEFFTHKRGNSYLISPNEQILFCSTLTNHILVTDSMGQIIWKMKLPVPTYRVEYINSLLLIN